jgi:hypothetical protein
MDYHLHQNGKNVGVFPLEELRGRVVAGELTGAELVWGEGMANWEPLSAVLHRSGLMGAAAQPPPIPPGALRPQSKKRLAWTVAAIVLAAVAGAGLLGFMGIRFVRQVRQAVKAAQSAQGVNRTDGADVAGRPLPVTTNTRTEADVRKRSREFRVRQYVEGYRKNANHSAPWDAQAEQLLESWIAINYGGETNLPSPQELGDKLAALPGCNEPLVLTAAAANALEVHEKIRRLERALAGYDKSRHKGYPKFYAAVTLGTELGDRSGRLRSLDDAAMGYFTAAFADGSFEPRDEEEIAEVLMNGWARAFFRRNGAAVQQVAGGARGFDWLALVLEGEYEINEAWRARGGGYANTVTDKGWQDFAAHLAKAQSALTRAWKQQPRRPWAATRMVTVSMGTAGAEEMRTWFDWAVEAQIDYPQAWSDMRWGLRPRWHGSHEALLALGVRAVDTKRFDTDVPRKLFDCISDIESELELPPGQHIYGRADVWPDVQRMYEGYVAEPSQEKWRRGWRSTYAAVAFLGGHTDVAREQLEAVNWQPVMDNLKAWGRDLSLMPLQVAALTGKSGAQVARAESSYDRFDLASAVKIYTELSAAPEADERTRELSRCRLAALKEEQMLARGEWVPWLPGGTNDPNWALSGDKIRRLDDGALEVESGPQGHGFYSRTRLGAAFEVTGEFEVVRSSNQDFQAGLVMGLPDSMRSEWYAFLVKRNASDRPIASFSRGFSAQQVAHQAPVADRRNEFRFLLQNGRADAWVNGTQVLHKASPVKNLRLHSGSLLGIGAYNDMNETVLRYRNVKARRLVAGRPAAEAEQ